MKKMVILGEVVIMLAAVIKIGGTFISPSTKDPMEGQISTEETFQTVPITPGTVTAAQELATIEIDNDSDSGNGSGETDALEVLPVETSGSPTPQGPGQASTSITVADTKTATTTKTASIAKTAANYTVKDIENKTMYATKSVRIRGSVSTDSVVVDGLMSGWDMKATGETSNGWIHVSHNGGSVYASESYLSTTKPDTAKETTAIKKTTGNSGSSTTKVTKPAQGSSAAVPTTAASSDEVIASFPDQTGESVICTDSRQKGSRRNRYSDTIDDLTKGSPLRLIIGFITSMCLDNLFQQLYSLADSIITGRFIGVDVLAAIGSTSFLIFLVIGRPNGITSDFTIIITQQSGVERYNRMRHYLAQSIHPCVAFVVVVTIGLPILDYLILRMMNMPEVVIGETGSYMTAIYVGSVVTVAYNALVAALRALGDGKSSLYFLIISTVLSIIMDIMFIMYFWMGVAGCGYTTVTAQAVSILLCLLCIIKKFDILRLHKPDFEPSVRSMGRLPAIGILMGLQLSITAVGTIIAQGAINVFGLVYIIGSPAGGKIQNIACTMFMVFGATIATFVGQNHGAGRMDRAREGVKVTQIPILIWSMLMMFIIYFFGKYLIMIFTDPAETQVVEIALTYFRVVSWYYSFLGNIFLHRNAFQGLDCSLASVLGGIFKPPVRAGVVVVISGIAGCTDVRLFDSAIRAAALIPIVPHHFCKMKKVDFILGESRL